MSKGFVWGGGAGVGEEDEDGDIDLLSAVIAEQPTHCEPDTVDERAVRPKRRMPMRPHARSRRHLRSRPSNAEASRLALRLIAMYWCHFVSDVEGLRAVREKPKDFKFAKVQSVAAEILMTCPKAESHGRHKIGHFCNVDVNAVRDCTEIEWTNSESEVPAFHRKECGLQRLEAVLCADCVLFRADREEDYWVQRTPQGPTLILDWRELGDLIKQNVPVDLFYEQFKWRAWPQRCQDHRGNVPECFMRNWRNVKMTNLPGRTLYPHCTVQRQTFCRL